MVEKVREGFLVLAEGSHELKERLSRPRLDQQTNQPGRLLIDVELNANALNAL